MGAFSILNNIAALYAQGQLGISSANLTQSITRLSSGKRINSGADDAAGLMIADSLMANARAIDQTIRNANDRIRAGQIADSALLAVAAGRAAIGAGSNRLHSAVPVMQNQSLNTRAAESTIRDADMAQEISNLTKYPMLSRTGTAAPAQANATGQIVLSLLQGLR